jgi:hypothetical protein
MSEVVVDGASDCEGGSSLDADDDDDGDDSEPVLSSEMAGSEGESVDGDGDNAAAFVSLARTSGAIGSSSDGDRDGDGIGELVPGVSRRPSDRDGAVSSRAIAP